MRGLVEKGKTLAAWLLLFALVALVDQARADVIGGSGVSGLPSTIRGVKTFTDAISFQGAIDLGNGASDIIRIPSTLPSLKFYENDQGVDARVWALYGQGGGLGLRLETDAYGAGENAWYCTRSGAAVVQCIFDNGAVDIDETLNVDGASTFNAGIWRIGTSPDFYFNETDGGADQTLWRIYADGGSLMFTTRTDANGAGETGLRVSRAGTAIDTWTFQNGAVDIDETLNVDGAVTLNGGITLGNAAGDLVTFTGRVASDVLPSSDNARDLGSAGNSWNDVFADGNITHGKACDTGYTRAGPGYCVRSSYGVSVLTRDTCTSITPPAGANALDVVLIARAKSNNGTATRLTTASLWSNSACNATQYASLAASTQEQAATAAGTVLDTNSTRFPVATGGTIYGTFTDDTGNQGDASYSIVGYWDN